MTQFTETLKEQTVAVYESPEAAEAAIAQLQKQLAPKRIFRVFEEGKIGNAVASSQIGKSAKGAAIAGGILGSLSSFLASFIAVSFIESLAAGTADARLYMLTWTLAGGLLGAGGFGVMGAAARANPPNPEAGRHLLKVQGTEAEIAKAAEILAD